MHDERSVRAEASAAEAVAPAAEPAAAAAAHELAALVLEGASSNCRSQSGWGSVAAAGLAVAIGSSLRRLRRSSPPRSAPALPALPVASAVSPSRPLCLCIAN